MAYRFIKKKVSGYFRHKKIFADLKFRVPTKNLFFIHLHSHSDTTDALNKLRRNGISTIYRIDVKQGEAYGLIVQGKDFPKAIKLLDNWYLHNIQNLGIHDFEKVREQENKRWDKIPSY